MSELPPPPARPDQPGWAPMPTWQTETPAPSIRYASFWQRAFALLLDGLVVTIIAIPLMAGLFDDLRAALDRVTATTTPSASAWNDLFAVVARMSLREAVVSFVYAVVMIGVWNATVGKFALGLRVRKVDGSRAAWREAALRPVLQAVIGLIPVPGVGILSILDYLWMLWDDRKQTLHDKIAGTIVVRTG